MSIPSEVTSYFTPDEIVLKQWRVKNLGIYATQYRIFLCKQGWLSKEVVEASYEHISSIELGKKRPLKRLASAVAAILLGVLLAFSPFFLVFSIILWITGVALLAWFIIGVQAFTLHVVGRRAITIPKDLGEVVRFVREKRPQEVYMRAHATKQTESKEIKEIIKEVVMIPCPYCGSLMPQTSTYCPNCGAKRKI